MEENFNSNNDCHEELQGVDSENFIQLLDGRKLQCFPRKDVAFELLTKEPNGLDMTSEYLRLHKHSAPKQTEKDKKELVKLFSDNVFLIIANRERILSDSRMFLAPVPVSNGLAYSGAFPEPSLGIYVEWWLNCPSSVLFDEADNLSVVWSLAGSPLSGSNQCATVNEDGAVEYRQLSCFRMLWPSFSDICYDYYKAKTRYEAYSLSEAIAILKDETKPDDYERSIREFGFKAKIFLLKSENNRQKKYCEDMRNSRDNYRHLWHIALFQLKIEEVRSFYDDYMSRKEQAEKRVAELREENRNLRRRSKAGELTNKEYEPQLTRNKKELSQIPWDLEHFADKSIDSLFPELSSIPDEGYRRSGVLDELIKYMSK